MDLSLYKLLSSKVKPPKRTSNNTNSIQQPEKPHSKDGSPLPQLKSSPNGSNSKMLNHKSSEKPSSLAASRKRKSVPQSKVTSASDRSENTFTGFHSTLSNYVHSSDKENSVSSNYRQLKPKSKGSKFLPPSVQLSDQSIFDDWKEWTPVIQSRVPLSKYNKKNKAETSEQLFEPSPMCNIKRPGEYSKKRFLKFATAVYADLLKFHENKYFEDQEFELNFSTHKAIRDLFLIKKDFLTTDFVIEDPSTTNFYRKFLSWGVGLLNDDLSEEKILEFIIKVCCCALSVQSEYPCLEGIVKENAVEAIAESCVICISKLPNFRLKIE